MAVDKTTPPTITLRRDLYAEVLVLTAGLDTGLVADVLARCGPDGVVRVSVAPQLYAMLMDESLPGETAEDTIERLLAIRHRRVQ
jgi:hypothetical protein